MYWSTKLTMMRIQRKLRGLHFLPIVWMVIVICILRALRMPGMFYRDKTTEMEMANANTQKLSEIFVVEEHHEVLPIWFDAAYRGLIPSKGNTLIHIDGHSDMAPPDLIDNSRAWRFPRNKKDVDLMIQKNDVFILGAVMTGLINRVVWIWPEWDNPNHDANESIYEMEIGWTTLNKSTAVCVCEINSNDSGQRARKCTYSRFNEETGDEEEVDLNKEECFVLRSYVYEEIHEKTALKRLQDDNLLKHDEKIMLDIDEDYHGCTYAIMPLLNAGLNMTWVEAIDKTVSEILCPSTSEMEKESDLLLMKVLDIYNKARECRTTMSKKCPTTKELLSRCRDEFMNGVVGPSMRCKKTNHLHYVVLVESLLHAFSKLTQSQLKALHYVGFCSTTTPKALDAEEDRLFKTCHGANTPDESYVIIHSPTANEVSTRTSMLNSMLLKLRGHTVNPITICRSVRDGYTPRQHFHEIERNVISAVSSTFSTPHIRYDIDLLGGKLGWRTEKIWKGF